MKKHVPCEVCGHTQWKPFLPILVQCRICGLVRAAEIPTEQQIQKIYQKQYFFGDEYSDYINDRLALEKNFFNRIKYLSRLVPLRRSTVLEIGSAYGYFLNSVKGEAKKAFGFDITKDGIEFAQEKLQVDARLGSFLDYSGEKVDLICMWDVIEHLTKPDAFVAHISRSLKTGGYVALTTGDISSVLARWQKANWRLIHPPTHLYYFSTATIRKILARHGLEIVSIRYVPFYRNLASVINQLLKKQLLQADSRGLLGVLYKGTRSINFPVNTLDIMEVVAKKVT